LRKKLQQKDECNQSHDDGGFTSDVGCELSQPELRKVQVKVGREGGVYQDDIEKPNNIELLPAVRAEDATESWSCTKVRDQQEGDLEVKQVGQQLHEPGGAAILFEYLPVFWGCLRHHELCMEWNEHHIQENVHSQTHD
jgi:hypothetical protein